MRTIAIETTDQSGSVAALVAGELIAVHQLDPTRRSAVTLAPALRDLLSEAGWQGADVQLVAVAVGPGSFTGLRIGVTTAKTLAYASGAAVQAVNTLEVIAAQGPADCRSLWTVVDAHRNQLFTAQWRSDADRLAAPSQAPPRLANLQETKIEDIDAWLTGLRDGDNVSGPILSRLASRLPSGVTPVAEACWSPSAEFVGRLAWEQFERGQRDDMWTLVPQYYRLSAAEEKLLNKAPT